jgi:hypothetical protein
MMAKAYHAPIGERVRMDGWFSGSGGHLGLTA